MQELGKEVIARLKKKAKIVYDDADGELLHWDVRERRAAATSVVDYGCNIKNGQCRRYNGPKSAEAEKLCCHSCYINLGYLQCIPKQHTKSIIALFLPNVGFWRKGVGCILPRKWRSNTCLRFNCSVNDDAVTIAISRILFDR
jgi:hypothetical protein